MMSQFTIKVKTLLYLLDLVLNLYTFKISDKEKTPTFQDESGQGLL